MRTCTVEHDVVTLYSMSVRHVSEKTFLPLQVTPGVPMVIVTLVEGAFTGVKDEAIAVTLTPEEAEDINSSLSRAATLTESEIGSLMSLLMQIQEERRPDLFQKK